MKGIALLVLCTLVVLASGDVIAYTSGTSLGTNWDCWCSAVNVTYVDSNTTMQFQFNSITGGSFGLYYGLGWDIFLTPTLSFQLYSTIANIQFQFNEVLGGHPSDLGSIVPLTNFTTGSHLVFPTNSWVDVVIPLNYTGFHINATEKVYLMNWIVESAGILQFKNIKLVSPPISSHVSIEINAGNILRPISTGIYGVNFASKTQITNIGYTNNRKGGNSETRYNWQVDVNNHASDYFFQNTPNTVANVQKLPFGSSSDVFASDTLAGGALPIMQLTTIGWACANSRDKKCAFDEKKYGAQQSDECSFTGDASYCVANCGNGVLPNGANVVGNNPTDTSNPVDQTFAVNYITHLRSAVGTGANYFMLDNECGLWHETHRDVHPKPVTYDEVWNNILNYGSAIKSAFPGAYLFGPSSWNFCEYMWSPSDGQCVAGPDFVAHNSTFFSVYLMQQMAKYYAKNGVRLLDYFDVHYYPDGLYPDSKNTNNAQTDAQRLRSLKSLYDPRYTDETWLGTTLAGGPQQLQVIPRFKKYIATYAPWLKFSISEYNWGDKDRMVQTLCQIEALAIFAREGVDMAMRFQAPASGSMIERAFLLFMNYDGTRTMYSGNAVSAQSSNSDMLPVYSAINQQQKLFYILLINKDPANSYTASMNISGVTLVDKARVFILNETGWTLSSLSPGSLVSVTVPAYNAYMIVYDINGGHAATGTTFASFTPTTTGSTDKIKNSANTLSGTFTFAVTILLFFVFSFRF